MLRAAGKAPRWVRDVAATKFHPAATAAFRNDKLGRLGAASEGRHGNILAYELECCGLKRMADEAEKGTYQEDQHKLVEELRFALGLKSLSMKEVGMIGRLHKRVIDGEFHKLR